MIYTLLMRFLRYLHDRRQADLFREQELVALHQVYQTLALDSQRLLRDLVVAFRIAVDMPEIDLREDLDKLLADLEDSIALVEEHVL